MDTYQAVLDDWIREGVIEEVKSSSLEGAVHYLPHRPVVKLESKTTPVSPLFDASCKTPGFPCLNDCLEKGPNLIELLPSILLRFRENRIGLVADIRKAFLMISVRKEDRDFLRFLCWENEETGKVRVFRHCRVVFGVNCSPFLLGAVLQHFLKRAPQEGKVCAEKIQQSLYVDNCVTSVTTREELETFKGESTKMLARVKFDLRLWEDNINPTDNTAEETTAVLGLCWDKVTDTLCYPAKIEVPDVITKRTVLSTAQKVFDPLGFLSPALLLPKLLLQESWALKMGWDAELPEDMRARFRRWVSELEALSKVKIPRWMTGELASWDTWSLHMFCDASKVAYAAAVYLCCTTSRGVSVQLLQAKARVAPLTTATIPRLELLACLIGSRLAQTVQLALGLEDIPSWYWSDSTTAIIWIQGDGIWGVFVAIRARDILQHTKATQWRHVPGEDNPAKGCSPTQLLKSRWWEGTNWLRHEQNAWPTTAQVVDEESVTSEMKKGTVTLVRVQSKVPWYMERFSTFLQIVCLVAWVSRWSNRRSGNQGSLGTGIELCGHEIQRAEIILMGLAQREVFKATT